MATTSEDVPQEKNIVVLGLTQNGKSSFVHSILKYAGENDPEASEAPAIGNGSASQTQDVRKYSTTIDIRRYIARKNGQRTDITHTSEGSRAVITYDDEGREDSRKYEPLVFKETVDPETKERVVITQEFEQSIRKIQAGLIPDTPEPSGCILKLNMYDTPGLSDSEGLKDLEKDFVKQGYTATEAREAATTCNRNLVDEKHKIAIMNAVKNIGTLHGVCIVIRDGKNFGQELKELKSIVETFRSISPDLNFYMIHTRVTNVTMFQAKTLNRIPKSEEFFALRATHFFINNEPDLGDDLHEGDPLSQHFAYRALSDFLFELTEASGVNITKFKYQKSDTSLEEVVASSLRIYAAYIEANNRILQEKIRLLDLERRPLLRIADVYEKERDELRSRRNTFDTTERIKVGTACRELKVGFLRSSKTVTFPIATNSVIRAVECSPENPPSASWDRSSDGIGRYMSNVRLTVHYGHVTASVTAFSFRCDVYSDTISSITSQMNSIADLRRSKVLEAYRLEQQQDKYKSEISANGARLTKLESLIEAIRARFVDDEEISDSNCERTKLRNSNNLYCVAKGHNSELEIPRELIPHIKSYEGNSRKRLYGYAECHYRARCLVAKSLVTAKRMIVRNQKARQQLKDIEAILGQHLSGNSSQHELNASLTDIVTKVEIIEVPDTASEKEVDLTAIFKSRILDLLHPFRAELEQCIEGTTTMLQGILEKVYTIEEWLDQALEELQRFREDWNARLQYHEESYDAAHQAADLVDQESYSLAQFTILRLAFEEIQRNPEAEDPFVKIAQSIAYSSLILKD
ncbi:hypothetical protein TWF730_008705 [Orbilia blumenaviensis]|uniref:G domain-containing protein n=1 Tax=Orbilia blumenaviensis TaxID=1796055 RepID=A0AAV9V687_9PEZI